jgi:hypothetical protein
MLGQALLSPPAPGPASPKLFAGSEKNMNFDEAVGSDDMMRPVTDDEARSPVSLGSVRMALHRAVAPAL